jgi:hypothetical protein
VFPAGRLSTFPALSRLFPSPGVLATAGQKGIFKEIHIEALGLGNF